MGWYVHLHVVHNVLDGDRFVGLARAELEALGIPCGDDAPFDSRGPSVDEWTPWAAVFLNDIVSGEVLREGPKGLLALWGRVTNGTNGRRFVQSLLPFYAKAFAAGALLRCYHVLVFEEQEQSTNPVAWEIAVPQWAEFPVAFADEFAPQPKRTDYPELGLCVRHHAWLPFRWGQ